MEACRISSRVLFLCRYFVSFITWMGVPFISWCLLGNIYTLWSRMGTLISLCRLILNWFRYDARGVGLWDLLMVARCGADFIWLHWIDRCLGLGKCLLGEVLCCTAEYFRQCFKCLPVTDRMVCLLFLKFFTSSRRSFYIPVAASLGVSMVKRLWCGHSWYWSETQSPSVLGTWNFIHL